MSMLIVLKKFYMGGYGFYVWTAYLLMAFFLIAQWLFAWRRLRAYLRQDHE